MGIENSWLPLIGVALGSISAVVGSYFQHRWTTKREAQSRVEERETELRIKQLQFQQDTMVELQDTVAKLSRATGKAFHQDVMNYKKSGKWQKQPIGDDVSTDHNLLCTRCNVLSSRLQNDQIRQSTTTFVDGCHAALSCSDQGQGESIMLVMVDNMRELHDQIGVTLRSIQLT